MAGRFSIEAVFRATDRVTAPIKRMSSRFKKNMRVMGESVDRVTRKVRKLGKTASASLGVGGATGAVLILGAAMAGVVLKGAEFEQALVGASARFGDGIDRNSEQFREMTELTRQLGATTEFTATQAAGGLNFLAKAGFEVETSLKLLPGIVDLATAAEMDLARASDIATDALGAFGLASGSAEDIQRNFALTSDRMAKTTRIANVNMEQLFETIKKGGPAATAANVPMETFLAFTAQLAGSGLKASDAGTALKNIFLQLAKSPVQSKLKSMGVQVLNTQGEFRDFADIMDDLNESFTKKGLGGGQKVGVLNELFGLRGITGVANVLQSGTAGLRKYRTEILDSKNETANLAKVLRNTREGQIKTLTSAFESLTLSVSDANEGGIGVMLEMFTKATRAVDTFVQTNPALAKWAGTLLVIGAAALLVTAAVAGIVIVGGFLAGTVASIAGVAVAVAGVTLAVSTALGNWIADFKPVQNFFDSLLEGSQTLRSIANFVTGDLDSEIANQQGRQTISPADRLADSIDERRTTENSTLEIKGAPEGSVLTTPKKPRGTGITMKPSGAFAGA